MKKKSLSYLDEQRGILKRLTIFWAHLDDGQGCEFSNMLFLVVIVQNCFESSILASLSVSFSCTVQCSKRSLTFTCSGCWIS